jgi:DNA-binding NarL/FixJ family response regulator
MYLALLPDVMLLDLRLPNQSGFDVVRTILKSYPDGRIIILSSAQGDASIYTAISLGVKGYLLKGIDGATLAEQVRHVVAGGRALSPETAEKLSQYITSGKLSDREVEVLGPVSQGKSNKEIADLLLVACKRPDTSGGDRDPAGAARRLGHSAKLPFWVVSKLSFASFHSF